MAELQLCDLLPELHDHIFSFCTIKDVKNVALCNHDHLNAFKRILFSHLRVLWTCLKAWPTFADKQYRFQYTNSLTFYNHILGGNPEWSCISKNYIKILQNCCNLKKLHLQSANCCASVETALQISSSTLIDLELSYCYGLESPAFQFMKNTSLKRLSLYSCNISDNVVEKVVQNTELVEFGIDHCIGLSKYSLMCISEMSTLKKLTFSKNGNTTGFYNLLKLKNIKELKFESVTIGNEELDSILSSGILLTSLSLLSCSYVNDNGFFSLTKQKSLTRLDLSFNDITDKTLNQVGKLPCLMVLVLIGCKGITDDGIKKLQKLKIMHSLSVDHCTTLTDRMLPYLSAFPLKRLTLNGCYLLTGKGMSHLTYIKTLEDLEVTNCVNVSYDGLDNFALMKLKRLKLTVSVFRPGYVSTFLKNNSMKRVQSSGGKAAHWEVVQV